MLRKMYTIYDSCSGVHDLPFAAHNEDHAVRNVRMALQEENHPIARSPHDFHLKFVGVYDDSTGVFTPAEVVEVVVSVSSLVVESEIEDA